MHSGFEFNSKLINKFLLIPIKQEELCITCHEKISQQFWTVKEKKPRGYAI